jgi:uncharacterized protein (TIGR02996 family)
VNSKDACDPLLQAVLASPDDDAPRIAFADACSDVVRGCFIRLQCGQFKKYGSANPEAQDTEAWTIRQLLGVAYGRAECWLPVLPFQACELTERGPNTKLVTRYKDYKNPVEWGFRRGFVYEVICEWKFWRENSRPILSRDPLKLVTLRDWPQVEKITEDSPASDIAIATENAVGENSIESMLTVLEECWPGITMSVPKKEKPALKDVLGWANLTKVAEATLKPLKIPEGFFNK